MSRMGGSFPLWPGATAGEETRTERVKRLERERVLDEIEKRISAAHADPLKAGKGWRLVIQEVIEELREGEA